MNVKPGDLAIQIKSVAGNEGNIVEVIKFLGDGHQYINGQPWDYYGSENLWHIRNTRPVKSNLGKMVIDGAIPDAWLRPISGLPDAEEIQDENPIKEVA
jgi:hypothetical protein